MRKILYIISTIMLMCFVGSRSFAQTMPDTYFESEYGKLKYGFFVPKDYDEQKSYPLVMFLHGWSNNYTVYLDYYNEAIQQQNPCFVYTPKTPVEWGDWSGWSWEGTDFRSLSEPTKAALHVLDSLTKHYAIDTNRLYVYGISMGGEGVFDLLHKLPGKFAAGISICGGGFAHWAENISQTPFWMFHGSADEINPPDLTERVYNSLLEMGAIKMRYTNYPGYGHAIWDKAQSEPSFYDWMFAFSKNTSTCEPPQGNLVLSATVTDKINLQWNDIRNENSASEKIWYYSIYNSSGLQKTLEFNTTKYSFAVERTIDTFWIEAVNYCFEKSAPSNMLYYNEGVISGPSKIQGQEAMALIFNQGNTIFIDISDKTALPVNVQLVSMEGKVLLNKKYLVPERITIDVSEYSTGLFIVNIEVNNKLISKKLAIYTQ